MLYAYIIQGLTVNWLLPLSTRQCASRSRLAVLSRSPCFHRSLKIRASPDVKNEHRRVNSIFLGWGCRSPAGSPLCCAALLLLQGSFQCMEPDGEQRTQRGLGTAMYCSARSSAMHTHSLPFLLCLWQSLNLLLYLSTLLWPMVVSFVFPHLFSSDSLCAFPACFSQHSYGWLQSIFPLLSLILFF